MSNFYTIRIQRWKKWVFVISAALFAAIYLFTEFSSFSVFSTDKGPEALIKSGESTDQLALTFNISWGQEKVHDILDVLEKENVQATFFVSGEWAERHPDILKKITDNKHELGMLGYRYKSYVKQDIEEVRKDLLQAKETFRKLGYSDITLLRPPSGHFNKEVLKLTEKFGFSVIYWSVNPSDWKSPGTQKIIDRVLDHAKGGDILLLHASDAAKQTAGALKDIIPNIKKKGLKFVNVSQLISNSSSSSSPLESK
ncbi:polysaccharide deacetylase family sporulation protein PdaB [Salirhabdus salicampi]|uniref:polysaccharide deacetylase family sporulation protein PdaB n=1 Tax=Salirhabdus salicampi TaxID=476102 RepID=UPI0020C3DFEF|nr:polysaccharide deacetylase family sporulation protein PdaB [Salirhabdus salicampi]